MCFIHYRLCPSTTSTIHHRLRTVSMAPVRPPTAAAGKRTCHFCQRSPGVLHRVHTSTTSWPPERWQKWHVRLPAAAAGTEPEAADRPELCRTGAGAGAGVVEVEAAAARPVVPRAAEAAPAAGLTVTFFRRLAGGRSPAVGRRTSLGSKMTFVFWTQERRVTHVNVALSDRSKSRDAVSRSSIWVVP